MLTTTPTTSATKAELVTLVVRHSTVTAAYSERADDLPYVAIDTGKALEMLRLLPGFRVAEEMLVATSIHPDQPPQAAIKNPIVDQLKSDPKLAPSLVRLREQHGDDTILDLPTLPHLPTMGRHCVAVATTAVALARSYGLDEQQQALCGILGLLHDSDRIGELLITRLRQAGIAPSQLGIPDRHGGAEILRRAGVEIDRELANKASSLTGHESLGYFLEPANGCFARMRDRDPTERIVHLADDLCAGVVITDVSRRILNSDFRGRYPFHFEHTLIPTEEGEWKETRLLQGARAPHLIDIQIALAHAICSSFAPAFQPSGDLMTECVTGVHQQLQSEHLVDAPSEATRNLQRGVAPFLSLPGFRDEWRIRGTALNALLAAHYRVLSLGEGGKHRVKRNASGETSLRADLGGEDAMIQILRSEGFDCRIESEEHGTFTIGAREPRWLVRLDGIDGTKVYESDRANGGYGTLISIFPASGARFQDWVFCGAMYHARGEMLFATPETGTLLLSPTGLRICRLDPNKPEKLQTAYVDRGWQENSSFFDPILSQAGIRATCRESSAWHYYDLVTRAAGEGGPDLVCECSRPPRKGEFETPCGYGLTIGAGGVVTTQAGLPLDDLLVESFGDGRHLPMVAARNEFVAKMFWDLVPASSS